MGNQLLTKLALKTGRFLKKNSSTILTVIAAGGVVVTTVSAVKVTPEAMRRIEEAEEEKGEDLTRFEVVKVAAPVYVPTFLFGASTIACIFGAHVVDHRKQASLISAYAFADTAHKDYRRKLVELYGEEADENIRTALAMEKREEGLDVYAPGLCPLVDKSEQILFYDEFLGKYFEASMTEVLNAEFHFNRNFALSGCMSMEDWYSFLGIEAPEWSRCLGWNSDSFWEDGLAPWIEFDHRKVVMDDGLECIIISFPWEPKADFDCYE